MKKICKNYDIIEDFSNKGHLTDKPLSKDMSIRIHNYNTHILDNLYVT